MNLFLDLDNTLVFSERRKKNFICTPRPYLQKFLDFVFANFQVSIWTAASKKYAEWVISTFILTKPNRKLHYLLHDEHSKVSMKQYGTLKDLRLLSQILHLPDVHSHNTLLVDDLIEVCQNQRDKCINIFPFTGDMNDKELLKMIDILAVR